MVTTPQPAEQPLDDAALLPTRGSETPRFAAGGFPVLPPSPKAAACIKCRPSHVCDMGNPSTSPSPLVRTVTPKQLLARLEQTKKKAPTTGGRSINHSRAAAPDANWCPPALPDPLVQQHRWSSFSCGARGTGGCVHTYPSSNDVAHGEEESYHIARPW